MKCRLTTNCLVVVMNLYMSYSYYIVAVGCEHTGCKCCYGRDLQLSGFTMPLLCEHSLRLFNCFKTNSMNSPTIVLTLEHVYLRLVRR